MAITYEYSTECALESSSPALANMAIQSLTLKVLPFKFTQGAAAGDAGSIAYLRRLPPGEVWFFPLLSEFQSDDMGTSTNVDIGFDEYTEPDGSVVSADPNLFDDGVDNHSAAMQAAMGSDYGHATAGDTGMFKKFNSREGVLITATFTDDTVAAAGVFGGYLVIGVP